MSATDVVVNITLVIVYSNNMSVITVKTGTLGQSLQAEEARPGKSILCFMYTCKYWPLYTTVTVNGNPLSMEVDTGVLVSITSLETFKIIQKGDSPLRLGELAVKLQTYTEEPI